MVKPDSSHIPPPPPLDPFADDKDAFTPLEVIPCVPNISLQRCSLGDKRRGEGRQGREGGRERGGESGDHNIKAWPFFESSFWRQNVLNRPQMYYFNKLCCHFVFGGGGGRGLGLDCKTNLANLFCYLQELIDELKIGMENIFGYFPP